MGRHRSGREERNPTAGSGGGVQLGGLCSSPLRVHSWILRWEEAVVEAWHGVDDQIHGGTVRDKEMAAYRQRGVIVPRWLRHGMVSVGWTRSVSAATEN
ncbi:hypothetical protein E2562_030261 [Oryza meyeriana var. granulata]|uniref:Uncharacterized protein n=1 Tax=Oryza meyeriana var. granulata TaxID=110450 RepID=A0A6G1D981_9ORYZ|nr:hypothetical protein E2562_030261 [Oryza meyeriana var. granulata]